MKGIKSNQSKPMNSHLEMPVVVPVEEMLGKRSETISHKHIPNEEIGKVEDVLRKNNPHEGR